MVTVKEDENHEINQIYMYEKQKINFYARKN